MERSARATPADRARRVARIGSAISSVDVASSLQAEVFVLRMAPTGLELAGPFGPGPWYIAVGEGEDPAEVVRGLTTTLLGEPLLLHSTSWRRVQMSVILSFIVLTRDGGTPELPGVPVMRTELARGSATGSPSAIAPAQVLEHGLRHLAWLLADDDAVGSALGDEWKRALGGYVAEPYRHLG